MKRTFNKGGRPVLEAAQRQKYIVSARLDSEHYFRLKKLACIGLPSVRDYPAAYRARVSA